MILIQCFRVWLRLNLYLSYQPRGLSADLLCRVHPETELSLMSLNIDLLTSWFLQLNVSLGSFHLAMKLWLGSGTKPPLLRLGKDHVLVTTITTGKDGSKCEVSLENTQFCCHKDSWKLSQGRVKISQFCCHKQGWKCPEISFKITSFVSTYLAGYVLRYR